jgi:hypothetical protein
MRSPPANAATGVPELPERHRIAIPDRIQATSLSGRGYVLAFADRLCGGIETVGGLHFGEAGTLRGRATISTSGVLCAEIKRSGAAPRLSVSYSPARGGKSAGGRSCQPGLSLFRRGRARAR